MNRRDFIKHLGIGVAIPLLPSLLPRALWANQKINQMPKRLAFVYSPNGKVMNHWTPKTFGRNFELPQTLRPFTSLKNQIQVLSGLAHLKAFANGDGAGDHARANATFLTGCQARKTAGPNIKIGISIDQVIANKIGSQTLLPSMELSCDTKRTSGSCDSGYSCAYQFNLSWKSETTPMPPESNPKLAYQRLFNDPFGEKNSKTAKLKMSLLEEASKETKSFKNKLSTSDKNKLDEYLESLYSIEMRISKIDQMQGSLPKDQLVFDMPENFQDHIRLMMDIMVVAFKADATRVISFMLAHEGSDRSFPNIGVSEAHHQLSHHKGNADNITALQKIDLFYSEQMAYFLEKMQGIKEENGSLLDNSMVIYGCGIADGDSHSHRDLPIILAGGKNCGLQTGRHVQYPKDTPMTNLYLSLAEKMGVSLEKFGDSTEKIKDQ